MKPKKKKHKKEQQVEKPDQAAEFRSLVARAAMVGIQKNEAVPLQLFEQVWRDYFYPKKDKNVIEFLR